jgi:LEA14-like dessication related protein
MKGRACWLVLLIALFSIGCNSVAKVESPAGVPAPEPFPEFDFGQPVLSPAGSDSHAPATVEIQIPLNVDNPGNDRYTIQNLKLQAKLHREGEDSTLETVVTPEAVSGKQPAGEGPALDARTSLTWTIICKVPLKDIIEDLETIDQADSVPAEPRILVCTLASVLRNSRGEDTPIIKTVDIPLPRIYKPQVQIISIAVKRAELINTRLKVRILIKNPNPFPLSLSRFSYELYGNGRFWADGTMADLGTIASNEAREEDIYLLMNFINMKRDLLDQVIALKSVQYRFRGDLTIGTPFSYLPVFPFTFDRAGNSPVIE